MNNRFKHLIENLTLSLVSFVIAVVMAECLFRFALNYQFNQRVKEWHHPLYKILPDSPLEFSLIPNTSRTNRIPKTGEVWNYSINSDGFRGTEYNKKSSHSKNIICLGDSYTFGWAVNQEEVYPVLLGQLLRKNSSYFEINIYNLGVPGYNIKQEYYLLKSVIDKYQPDIVVLGYVMNDAEPQNVVWRRPNEKYKHVTFYLFAYVKNEINERIFSGKSILDPGFNILEKPYFKAFKAHNLKWLECKQNFFAIADLCRTKNISLVVVIFPDFTQRFDTLYPNKAIHEEVSQWSREVGVRSIDLLPEFISSDHKKFRVEGDGHPNAKALRKISEILAPIIQEYF